jgi:hypothetical protein
LQRCNGACCKQNTVLTKIRGDQADLVLQQKTVAADICFTLAEARPSPLGRPSRPPVPAQSAADAGVGLSAGARRRTLSRATSRRHWRCITMRSSTWYAARLPQLHRDWAHPRHTASGTGLAPPTSAPGTGLATYPAAHGCSKRTIVTKPLYPAQRGLSGPQRVRGCANHGRHARCESRRISVELVRAGRQCSVPRRHSRTQRARAHLLSAALQETHKKSMLALAKLQLQRGELDACQQLCVQVPRRGSQRATSRTCCNVVLRVAT